jgi:hypothetical protein
MKHGTGKAQGSGSRLHAASIPAYLALRILLLVIRQFDLLIFDIGVVVCRRRETKSNEVAALETTELIAQ